MSRELISDWLTIDLCKLPHHTPQNVQQSLVTLLKGHRVLDKLRMPQF